MNPIVLIANHPLVKLYFFWDTERWAFARYFLAVQAKSTELLSLLDTIEHYRCSTLSELAQEVS